MPFLDLKYQVHSNLRIQHGGTGNQLGYGQGSMFRALNGSNTIVVGSTVTRTTHLYPVVRMTTVTDESVLGVSLGTLSNSEDIISETDTAQGAHVAVAINGVVRVRLGAAATAGHYAFAHTTYGTAYSSATRGNGAFGRFLTSGTAGGLATVLLTPLAGAIEHGTPIEQSIVDAKGDLIVATAADTLTRLGLGTDTHVLTADSTTATGIKWAAPGGGGAASTWTQVVDEDGTSFANFTAETGTWSSDGTVIKQTDTTANFRRARYNTKIIGSLLIVEADIQIRTAGVDRIGSLLAGFAGTGTGGRVVRLNEGSDAIQYHRDAIAALQSWSATLAINTWYTLRVLVSGQSVSAYLDGTLVGSGTTGSIAGVDLSYIGLHSYQAEVWFRNIKAWVPALP